MISKFVSTANKSKLRILGKVRNKDKGKEIGG